MSVAALQARPFDPRDDERVVALLARLHADDPTVDAMSLERWRAFRGLAIFEEGRRFRVVEEAGDLAALLTVGKLDPRGPDPFPWRADPRVGGAVWRVRAYVDPPARRRGIASSLLSECEVAARAEGAAMLETFVLGTWTAARALAAARGFEGFVHDLFLSRAPVPFGAPLPEGVRLRPFEPGRDEPAWVALANATLVRDRGFIPETPSLVASYARAPGFACWIAEADGPIGYCHVERREGVGYVQALGVLSEWNGRGMGAALLSRGIETLRVPGVERIELCTEQDNARAQRLYARAGFVFHRDAFTMRKPLR